MFQEGSHEFRVGSAQVHVLPDEHAMGTAAQAHVRRCMTDAATQGKRIVLWLMAAPSGFAWYDRFVDDVNADESFASIVAETDFYQFDDYPIARTDPRFPVTFRHLLEDRLFGRLPRTGAVHLLELDGSDRDAGTMAAYAAAIHERIADPDSFVLQVKGVGMDGHWGFHGRETPLDSPPAIVSVAMNAQNRIQQTIDWPEYFPTVADVPEYAATSTVALFRQADAIVDLVPQASKSFATLMCYGTDAVFPELPSSVVTELATARAFLTEAAAQSLLIWRKRGVLDETAMRQLDSIWGDDTASCEWARTLLQRAGFLE